MEKMTLSSKTREAQSANERWMRYLGFPGGILLFLVILYLPAGAGASASAQAGAACFALALASIISAFFLPTADAIAKEARPAVSLFSCMCPSSHVTGVMVTGHDG